MSKYFRWAELAPREDIHVWEGTTKWGNHDVYPIPKKEHTYGTLGFYSYYAVSTVAIYGFTSASAYVSAGLSCWETVGAILLGASIAAGNSYLGARPGVDKSLGFTMMTRVTFGLWGSFLPLFTSLLANLVFSGIQAYYGGQAITLIIGAVIPQFQSMSNTLPLSAAITTRDLIGFFIYFLFYFPIVFYVPLHKLQRYLYPSVIITAVTFIGMLAWALKQNGGTGPLVSSSVQLTSLEKAFMFLQCASGNAATWGGGGDRLSDWTRYSKKRHSSTPAILTALPVMLTLTSIVGVLVTSAFYQMYGQEIWTPLGMLLYVQEVQYTPACRAGTFFAGIGLLSSQIYINIVQNTVAFGMDFAGMFPKYMSMKRGAVLLSIVAVACNPWRFLTQASIFIQVLSVFSVFATTTSATLNADYWLVRKRAWKVPDLYHEDGIYWYTNGWNLRAVAAWVLGIVPSLPGFVNSMIGPEKMLGADYKIFQITFFVGYPLAGLLYVAICKIFPPAGLGIQEQLDGYDTDVISSEDVIDGISATEGKDEVIVEEKKV